MLALFFKLYRPVCQPSYLLRFGFLCAALKHLNVATFAIVLEILLYGTCHVRVAVILLF